MSKKNKSISRNLTEDLIIMKDQLREMSPKWATDLHGMIINDEEAISIIGETFDINKLYRVFNGIVSNARIKIVVMRNAGILIDKYKAELESIK